MSFFERMADAAASLLIRGIGAGYAARVGQIERSTTARPVLVQVNFRYLDPPEVFRAEMKSVAPFLSHVEGLRFKIWSVDDAEGTANGTYLFEDRIDADRYLEDILPKGPVGDAAKVSDVEVRIFEVLVVPSTITRMP